MRYVILISLAALAGCDTVRETSGRIFGGGQPQPLQAADAVEASAETEAVDAEETVQTAAVEPEEPAPVVNTDWQGAKTTVAALGDPTKAGRWMETPLVDVERNARIVLPKTGAMTNVTLIPIGGDPGAGSRLSLDAMRALLAPIDELVELEVYAN
ncbi:hypothetical protein ACFORG_17700 [Lutimaribacter marinistellae]|uniref:D-galactarate dehydratase n=1 Tax=Lutimaribacter marinistellae TaxID=1820329 RepID=A0ABV7TP21_9RHOB